MLLDLTRQFITSLFPVIGSQHDGRLDHLSPYLIRHAGDGTLHHCRVGHHGTLHLEGADAVTGALDHIVGTSHKPVVAIFVAPRHIAGAVEVLGVDASCECLVAVVPHEKTQRPFFIGVEHNLPLLPILGRTTVVGDQVHPVQGVGHTHRARLGLHPGEGDDGGGGLGLTERLHHPDAGLPVEALVDRRVERLTRCGAVFQ